MFSHLHWQKDIVKKVLQHSENSHFSAKLTSQLISDTLVLLICKLCPKTNLSKLWHSSGRKIATISVVFKWLCLTDAILQFSWAKTRMQTIFKKSIHVPGQKDKRNSSWLMAKLVHFPRQGWNWNFKNFLLRLWHRTRLNSWRRWRDYWRIWQ